MRYKTVYLSIGTNLYKRIFNIFNAISKINKIKETIIEKISPIYETKAVGYLNQDDFLNLALKIKTKLKPFELLKEIKNIEDEMGRIHEFHWGPRLIDIDIIFYADLSLKREILTLPHKEYKKRNFVLKPLKDLGLKKMNKYIKESKGIIKRYNFKDKILISSCLLGLQTRYDGRANTISFFRKFVKDMNIIPICPEQLGGLKTPRIPCEIKGDKVISKDGEDFTSEFVKGAYESLKLANLLNCRIAILKAKSPSCGYQLRYSGKFNGRLVKENGLTAEILDINGIQIVAI